MMMSKWTRRAVLTAYVVSSLLFHRAYSLPNDDTEQDDATFWKRFLENDVSSTAPPTGIPTRTPFKKPTLMTTPPAGIPTTIPSLLPTAKPSNPPSSPPSSPLSNPPSSTPSKQPSNKPSPESTIPSVEPAAPLSSCSIDLEMTCTTRDNNLECADLRGEQHLQCQCNPCAQELVFRYTATPCTDQETTNGICVQMPGELPQNSARIFAADGPVLLFDDTIDAGTDSVFKVVLNPGACIPNKFLVFISDPDSSSINLRQMLDITTDCNSANGITLLDSIGSLGLTGYTCQGENPVPRNCFVDVDYDIVATNNGTVNLTITELSFALNGDERTTALSVDLGVNEINSAVEPAEISLCTEAVYTATSLALANDAGGITCQDEATVAFPIVITPFPPSAQSSSFPSQIRSASPSVEPSSLPSTTPVEDCVLSLDLMCTLPNGESCDSTTAPVEQCQGRPQTMGMIFNGGSCDTSSNVQDAMCLCEDFNGGPSAAVGQESFIIASSARGDGTVYYNGTTAIGETYFLNAGDDDLQANSNITIYRNNITTPSNIIQTLQFDTSCSGNLFLKDRFGASQVVEWVNKEQGTATCFVTATIDLEISVPAAITGDEVTLTSLSTRTNFAGKLNLTDLVFGQMIPAGGMLALAVPVSIDLTSRRRYTFLTGSTGETDLGELCEGVDVTSFAAGNLPALSIPTAMPTFFPTRSIAPSPDLETTACMLEAKISCVLDDDRNFGNCSGLPSTPNITCIGGFTPSSLSFQFTGGECPENAVNYDCRSTVGGINGAQQVFVEVNIRPPFFFSGVVGINETFVAPGPYEDDIRVWVYSVSESGQRGSEIQRLNLPTTCNPEDDLTLTNEYGGLTLTGFQNAVQGDQSIFQKVLLTYGFKNAGKLAAIAQSASLDSEFSGGPREILLNAVVAQKNQVVVLETEPVTINLQEKFEQDLTYEFNLEVSGIGPASTVPCESSATLSI